MYIHYCSLLKGPNGVPMGSHSLSWASDEKRPNKHGNIMIAKVWTPEDPRRHKNKSSDSPINGHDLLAECCSTITDVSN
jgi:hypothetical protein